MMKFRKLCLTQKLYGKELGDTSVCFYYHIFWGLLTVVVYEIRGDCRVVQ